MFLCDCRKPANQLGCFLIYNNMNKYPLLYLILQETIYYCIYVCEMIISVCDCNVKTFYHILIMY